MDDASWCNTVPTRLIPYVKPYHRRQPTSCLVWFGLAERRQSTEKRFSQSYLPQTPNPKQIPNFQTTVHSNVILELGDHIGVS
eukprot:6399929-Amphidinium_carterae.1